MANQMADLLLPHSHTKTCPHKNSHDWLAGKGVPVHLKEYTPFFNHSLLDEHFNIQKTYKSLQKVKQDLKESLQGQSENPYHLDTCVFSSSERVLQSSGKMSEIDPEILKLPAYINWAEEGKTTRIKYQGKCRSCYAFSGLASVESAILIK